MQTLHVDEARSSHRSRGPGKNFLDCAPTGTLTTRHPREHAIIRLSLEWELLRISRLFRKIERIDVIKFPTQFLLLSALAWFSALALLAPAARAQSNFPSHNFEIWNDDVVRVGLPRGELLFDLGPQSDFGSYYQLRAGAGYSFTPFQKGSAGAAFHITVAPRYDYYHKSKTPQLAEVENRFLGEITPSLTLRCWTINDRNRGEARFIGGNLNWRYRNRIEIRHPAHIASLDASVRYEFFYAPPANGWREGRFTAGFARHIFPSASAELYYLRQWGSLNAPFTINGIGVALDACVHRLTCE